MEEVVAAGKQKYENYREQFKRLKKALDNGFNLEAMFIEYAILEDRTESILRHAGKWDAYLKKRGKNFPTLNSKIETILKQMESNRKDLLNLYFNDDLLDNILSWKEERNSLIHALLKQNLEHNKVRALAEEGNELVKLLRNRSASYNRMIEKQKEKET